MVPSPNRVETATATETETGNGNGSTSKSENTKSTNGKAAKAAKVDVSTKFGALNAARRLGQGFCKCLTQFPHW